MPWLAIATMGLALIAPHFTTFPSLDGREAGGVAQRYAEYGAHRAPGALATLAAALLLFGGLQRWTSRLVAFLASMLLASSPITLLAGLQANGDGVVLLAAVVTLLAALRGLDPNAQPRLWPSCALWGAVAAAVLMGDLSVPLSVLGIALLLWRTGDRDRLQALLRPKLALPAAAALGAAILLGYASEPAFLAFHEAVWGTGLLALPFLLLPMLPLVAPAFDRLARQGSSRVDRVALAMGCGPLLGLMLMPWQGWAIGAALIPVASVFAAHVLMEGEDRTTRRRGHATHSASRGMICFWALTAGALALALLVLSTASAAPTIAAAPVSAIAALCVVALGALWGWQGRIDRLALAAVMASGLVCSAAMDVIEAAGPAVGVLIP